MNKLMDWRRSSIFTPELLQEGEKRSFTFTHEQNIISSQALNQAQLDDTAHKQAINSRQLFAGHVVGPRPMKWKKIK